jgi:hypothetical protein
MTTGTVLQVKEAIAYELSLQVRKKLTVHF